MVYPYIGVRMLPRWMATVLALVACVGPAASQAPEADPLAQIPWTRGPVVGGLGSEAEVSVPEDCVFTGTDGVGAFLDATENPSNGDERGVVYCLGNSNAGEEFEWFVVFEFRSDGYVKDDERDELDASKIFASIKEGTDRANELRLARGWTALEVTGWQREPYYDQVTNNMTWAILGMSDGEASINHSVRLLGRRGVMSADLVVSPAHYTEAVLQFDRMISDYKFLPGQTYAEWTKGDPIAKYGLTALVAGGAGAVLAKTGILQKFGKLIIVGFVAVLAMLRNVVASAWRGVTGATTPSEPPK